MNFWQSAIREWAWVVGADCPDVAWLLSDYDTWERNPHYRGPEQRHPEDHSYEDDNLTIVEINELLDEAAREDLINEAARYPSF